MKQSKTDGSAQTGLDKVCLRMVVNERLLTCPHDESNKSVVSANNHVQIHDTF